MRACWAEEIAARDDWNELKELGGGCTIPKAEERGIKLAQLRALAANMERRCIAEGWKLSHYEHLDTGPPFVLPAGAPASPATATLHNMDWYLISPATVARRCSLVEVLATAPQPPRWCVSYWWGTPFRDFMACIEQHAMDHQLDASTAFWICNFAETTNWGTWHDPADFPVHRAMRLAEGTISIIDEGGVALTRMWCTYMEWIQTQTPHLHQH